MMRACLFSGGKDSTLAVHRMHDKGDDVELLLTMMPVNEYSFMFHRPAVEFTSLQAEALGIKQVRVSTKGEKDKELVVLENALKKNKVTELVTGAVASNYQKKEVDAICARNGIKHASPLWHIDPLVELEELTRSYNAIITQVSAEGFDQSMLGARIDTTMVKKLIALNKKYGVNMLFEGGEAETFVLDAPLFRKRLEVTAHHTTWQGMVGRYVIDSVRPVEK